MATWIGTVLDVINQGAQVYQTVAGSGTQAPVGRGSDSSPAPATMFDPAITTTPAVMPIPSMALAGAGVRAMIPRVMTAVGTFTRSAAGRRLLALTKTVGIQAAATALGLSLADALGLLGEQVGRRRRRRGISARDLRITRRTNRRLICAAQDMRELCGATAVRRARRRGVCA